VADLKILKGGVGRQLSVPSSFIANAHMPFTRKKRLFKKYEPLGEGAAAPKALPLETATAPNFLICVPY